MTCNIGTTDRLIRVILGAGIVAAGVYFGSWWGALGLVPLVTAAVGWCPLYRPFRFSTCKAEEKPAQ